MPVFPLTQFPDVAGGFELSSEESHHLHRVLRVRSGQIFEASLPDGRRGLARLEIQGDSGRGVWLKEVEAPILSSLPAWLGIGLIRTSRLEWLIEKATELGVERLSLLQLSRGGISKFESISPNKIQRLRKISQETLKQCERNTFMQIDPPQRLETYLAEVGREAKDSQRLLLRERSLAPLLPKILGEKSSLRVFLVGPEGGFSDEELRGAEAVGFQSASLGPAVLRSETAALAALSYLHLHHASEGDVS